MLCLRKLIPATLPLSYLLKCSTFDTIQIKKKQECKIYFIKKNKVFLKKIKIVFHTKKKIKCSLKI